MGVADARTERDLLADDDTACIDIVHCLW